MPSYNPNDPHCVECNKFQRGCILRKKIEQARVYDIIDKALKEEFLSGVDIYYHLYSFVCKCSGFEKRQALTAEEVLAKIINGEALSEEEQIIADRIL
jgi:hypothetical protein